MVDGKDNNDALAGGPRIEDGRDMRRMGGIKPLTASFSGSEYVGADFGASMSILIGLALD